MRNWWLNSSWGSLGKAQWIVQRTSTSYSPSSEPKLIPRFQLLKKPCLYCCYILYQSLKILIIQVFCRDRSLTTTLLCPPPPHLLLHFHFIFPGYLPSLILFCILCLIPTTSPFLSSLVSPLSCPHLFPGPLLPLCICLWILLSPSLSQICVS